MPNSWITRKILPLHFTSTAKKISAYLLPSTTKFRYRTAIPTSLLLYMLDLWSKTEWHPDATLPQVGEYKSCPICSCSHFIRQTTTRWEIKSRRNLKDYQSSVDCDRMKFWWLNLCMHWNKCWDARVSCRKFAFPTACCRKPVDLGKSIMEMARIATTWCKGFRFAVAQGFVQKRQELDSLWFLTKWFVHCRRKWKLNWMSRLVPYGGRTTTHWIETNLTWQGVKLFPR